MRQILSCLFALSLLFGPAATAFRGARDSAPACRMACAGTSACCCRRAKAAPDRSALAGEGPMFLVSPLRCPAGCAVMQQSPRPEHAGTAPREVRGSLSRVPRLAVISKVVRIRSGRWRIGPAWRGPPRSSAPDGFSDLTT